MNDISSINQSNTVLSQISARRAAKQTQEATTTAAPRSDSVEVSETAQLLGRMQDLPINQSYIDAMRDKIDSGNYPSDDQLDAALDSLLGDLE